VAPFFGAALAIAMLDERPGLAFWLAAALMALGVWLHLSERHPCEAHAVRQGYDNLPGCLVLSPYQGTQAKLPG
jgi:hypothetical protein